MDLSALPPLRDAIAEHGLAARKGLGQHFLLDLNLTRKIVRAADVSAADAVLEIGPGPGGLTRALVETGACVVAVERDARCLPALQDLTDLAGARLRVVNDDALAVDEAALAKVAGLTTPLKIVANLPYNVGTELLIKWLIAGPTLWSRMALMFQKEVADRIVATPGTKAYGRLSVLAASASRPRKAFDLPARAFTPPPKVDSAVVVFDAIAPDVDFLALERATRAGFGARRKMLRASLKPLFGAETEGRLQALGLSPTARAEELSPADWRRVAAVL
ncbi:MAG: 16S rRNA (adenine(1518)-N(6)/adenine(1519)-N(6))-dimethyltransferase RsmA [Pseudomonadota bacterium]